MGANTFRRVASHVDAPDPDGGVGFTSAKQAFDALIAESLEEDGASYSGEIGMKKGCDLISYGTVKSLQRAFAKSQDILMSTTSTVADTHGPAGYITVDDGTGSPETWVFFGWAES